MGCPEGLAPLVRQAHHERHLGAGVSPTFHYYSPFLAGPSALGGRGRPPTQYARGMVEKTERRPAIAQKPEIKMAEVKRRGLLGSLLRLLMPYRNGAAPSPNGATSGRPAGPRRSDVDQFTQIAGVGQDWARTVYGEYYAASVAVYAAIRIRSETLARPPVNVLHNKDGNLPIDANHPAQRLLDRPNPWYSRGDLWRSTETYLNLWGSAFWALERGDHQDRWEIWPLRPDRMRILPDKRQYIRGYVYFGTAGPVAYTSDEIVWLRYFNPLEEYAGLSPIAPLRLSADMGQDALRFNRNFFKNSAQPDLIFTTEETMTDDEVEDFLPPLGEALQGSGQRPPPRHRQLHQGGQDPGHEPAGDGVHPGPALEPGGREPGLWSAHAPAVRLPAGHLLQHRRRREAVLAQLHGARDEVPGGAVEPEASPPSGLSGAPGRVRSDGRRSPPRG